MTAFWHCNTRYLLSIFLLLHSRILAFYSLGFSSFHQSTIPTYLTFFSSLFSLQIFDFLCLPFILSVENEKTFLLLSKYKSICLNLLLFPVSLLFTLYLFYTSIFIKAISLLPSGFMQFLLIWPPFPNSYPLINSFLSFKQLVFLNLSFSLHSSYKWYSQSLYFSQILSHSPLFLSFRLSLYL